MYSKKRKVPLKKARHVGPRKKKTLPSFKEKVKYDGEYNDEYVNAAAGAGDGAGDGEYKYDYAGDAVTVTHNNQQEVDAAGNPVQQKDFYHSMQTEFTAPDHVKVLTGTDLFEKFAPGILRQVVDKLGLKPIERSVTAAKIMESIRSDGLLSTLSSNIPKSGEEAAALIAPIIREGVMSSGIFGRFKATVDVFASVVESAVHSAFKKSVEAVPVDAADFPEFDGSYTDMSGKVWGAENRFTPGWDETKGGDYGIDLEEIEALNVREASMVQNAASFEGRTAASTEPEISTQLVYGDFSTVDSDLTRITSRVMAGIEDAAAAGGDALASSESILTSLLAETGGAAAEDTLMLVLDIIMGPTEFGILANLFSVMESAVEKTIEAVEITDSATHSPDATKFSEEKKRDDSTYFLSELAKLKDAGIPLSRLVNQYTKKDDSDPIFDRYGSDQRFFDGLQSVMLSQAKAQQDFYEKFNKNILGRDTPFSRTLDYRTWGQVRDPDHQKHDLVSRQIIGNHESTNFGAEHIDLMTHQIVSGNPTPHEWSDTSMGTTDKWLQEHRINQVINNSTFQDIAANIAFGWAETEAFNKPETTLQPLIVPPVIADGRGNWISVSMPDGKWTADGTEWTAYRTNILTGKKSEMSRVEFAETMVDTQNTSNAYFQRPINSIATQFFANNMSQFLKDDWINMQNYQNAAVSGTVYEPPTDGQAPTLISYPHIVTSISDTPVAISGVPTLDHSLMYQTPLDALDLAAAFGAVCYFEGVKHNNVAVADLVQEWSTDSIGETGSFYDQDTNVSVSWGVLVNSLHRRLYIVVNEFTWFMPNVNIVTPSGTHNLVPYYGEQSLDGGSNVQGSVHAGTYMLSLRIVRKLRNALVAAGNIGQFQRVVFCGKGCAGPLALLLAIDMDMLRFIRASTKNGRGGVLRDDQRARVYMFGSPRTGDALFARHMDHNANLFIHRISRSNELLSRFPPSRMGYRHSGDERVFFDDGTFTLIPLDMNFAAEKVPQSITFSALEKAAANGVSDCLSYNKVLRKWAAHVGELHDQDGGGICPLGVLAGTQFNPAAGMQHEDEQLLRAHVQSTIREKAPAGKVTKSHFEQLVKEVGQKSVVPLAVSHAKRAVMNFLYSPSNPARAHKGVWLY